MTTSMVASAAAQPMALPPYVPPWLPVGQRDDSCSVAPSAANGKPDAMPFAMQRMSGSTSKCSTANMRPVRPNPDCTSSATNRIPCCRQISTSPG